MPCRRQAEVVACELRFVGDLASRDRPTIGCRSDGYADGKDYTDGLRFPDSRSQARRIFWSREEVRCLAGGTNIPLRKSAKAWASNLVLSLDPSRSTSSLPV